MGILYKACGVSWQWRLSSWVVQFIVTDYWAVSYSRDRKILVPQRLPKVCGQLGMSVFKYRGCIYPWADDLSLGKNFHLNAANFWWPFLFLVIHRILPVFYLSLLSEIWSITLWPFFAKNLYFRTNIFSLTPFFNQFVLCHASNNTTSRNIGGQMHEPSPSQIWGASPQFPPKSLPMHLWTHV